MRDFKKISQESVNKSDMSFIQFSGEFLGLSVMIIMLVTIPWWVEFLMIWTEK